MYRLGQLRLSVCLDVLEGAGQSLTGKKKVFRCQLSPGTPCAQPWLVVVGGWQWFAVGGWSPLAVGGGWWLAVDGSWRLAVGGPLGAVLKGGP